MNDMDPTSETIKIVIAESPLHSEMTASSYRMPISQNPNLLASKIKMEPTFPDAFELSKIRNRKYSLGGMVNSANLMGAIADTRHIKHLSEKIKTMNEVTLVPLWAIKSLRKSQGGKFLKRLSKFFGHKLETL